MTSMTRLARRFFRAVRAPRLSTRAAPLFLRAGLMLAPAPASALPEIGLTAEGELLPNPAWRNASGAIITELPFLFSGASSREALLDVDSAAVQVRLSDAPTYPALVRVQLPSGCSIGSTRVADAHVRLLRNGGEAASLLSFHDAGASALALRFVAAGKYAAASGLVGCARPGTLRYCY